MEEKDFTSEVQHLNQIISNANEKLVHIRSECKHNMVDSENICFVVK
jgi:hypothetical protein